MFDFLKHHWKVIASTAAAIAVGALVVALAPVTAPALAVAILAGAAGGLAGYLVQSGLDHTKVTAKGVLLSTAIGGALGVVGFGVGKYVLGPAVSKIAGVLGRGGSEAGEAGATVAASDANALLPKAPPAPPPPAPVPTDVVPPPVKPVVPTAEPGPPPVRGPPVEEAAPEPDSSHGIVQALDGTGGQTLVLPSRAANGNLLLYRAVSEEELAGIQQSGRFSLDEAGEKFLSSSRDYAEQLVARSPDKYSKVVEVEVDPSTLDNLAAVGARNGGRAARATFPDMPRMAKGQTDAVFFKAEQGVLNLGFRSGSIESLNNVVRAIR